MSVVNNFGWLIEYKYDYNNEITKVIVHPIMIVQNFGIQCLDPENDGINMKTRNISFCHRTGYESCNHIYGLDGLVEYFGKSIEMCKECAKQQNLKELIK